MSHIGTTEVKRIAKLARIGLSDDEVATMSVEIGNILEFVEQLQAVDITDTPPTDQVTGLTDVWREDVVRSGGLTREQLLFNASHQKNGHIIVNRVPNG